MTRPERKNEERRTLDKLLSFLGIRPEEIDDKGETPDFMLQISGRTIGVEVTTYQSGKIIGRLSKRAIEAAWEYLKDFSNSFKLKYPFLKDIHVYFRFKELVPSKSEANAFLIEIEDFVCAKHSALARTYTIYSNY
jgi:hypothetical protein